MITIIAIGKKHEDWVAPGIERYEKRLRPPFNINWVLLPHSSLNGDQARNEESGRIADRLKPDDTVILLDERGKLLDSPAVAAQFDRLFGTSKNVVIIIGGAYGVNEQITSRADIIWSFSPLVFPHQLVRLMLVEQVYRAQQIAAGGSYHHE